MPEHNTTRSVLDRIGGFTVNKRAVTIAALTILFQAGGWATYQWLHGASEGGIHGAGTLTDPRVSTPAQQSTSLVDGVWVIGLVVVESLVIIGAWRLYKRLPDVWKQRVRKAAVTAAILYATSLVYLTVGAVAIVLLAGGFTAHLVLKRRDMDWITFNLAGVVGGCGAIGFISAYAAPGVVMVAMVLALVWDHVAVNLSDLMGDLASFASAASTPSFIIIPAALKVDRSAIGEYIANGGDGETPEGVGGIIGVGDFVFPGVLTVSTAAALGEFGGAALGAATGAIVAVFVLQAALEKAGEALPALPWLNTGAMLGFFVGAAATTPNVVKLLGVV